MFVGDAMEERVDELCAKAGELGMLKVPVFTFQEGNDPTAEQAFREIARLTGGAWCRFDPGAAAQLRELLRAAAAYAAGGREALRQAEEGELEDRMVELQLEIRMVIPRRFWRRSWRGPRPCD